MGKLKELEIERDEKYRGRVADTDLLLCELAEKINRAGDTIGSLYKDLGVAVRLLREAEMYVSNPYIDGEKEFPNWRGEVDAFIRKHSSIG